MADYHKFIPMKPQKLYTRRREKFYAAIVSHGVPARMRMLRKSHKTATKARDYARRCCDIYDYIFGLSDINKAVEANRLSGLSLVADPADVERIGGIFREPSAGDGLMDVIREPTVLDWKTGTDDDCGCLDCVCNNGG